MPTITLSVKYHINTSVPFSAQDLRDKFLSGIPTEMQGQSLSDDTIDFYIQSAQEILEAYLGMIIGRRLITETKDFYLEDWTSWGYMKTTFPVQMPVNISGVLGSIVQVSYPVDWIVTRKTNDGKTYDRRFQLVPNGGEATYNNTSALYLGSAFPLLNWWRSNRGLPGYWSLEYISGFPGDKIPSDILQALGMLATVPLLGILSDNFIANKGLGLGVASKSISLDGLSQSVSSYANGQTGIFGARMKQYGDQLWGANGKPGLLEILKDAYSAIIWTTC